MSQKGHCYCGEVQYEASLDQSQHIQCFCNECKYFSSGGPTCAIVVPPTDFKFTKGSPKSYKKEGGIVTRRFCGTCGSHLNATLPNEAVVIKIGTLDDKSVYNPSTAIFVGEVLPSICIKDDLQKLPGFPPM